MVRIAVRATKAIIRESARLVNLTLGRAGFFYAPQAPTRRATSGTNRRSIGSAYHAKEKSRYGVVFPCGNLHPSKPLTSLFFGLFRLRRRNKKLSVFRSAGSASIIRKPLLIIQGFVTCCAFSTSSWAVCFFSSAILFYR